MSLLGSIVLTGVTGKQYNFEIYSLDTLFNDVGAVYVFTKAELNQQGGHTHSVLYVGQTSELGTRLPNHNQLPCVSRNGVNRVCVLVESSEARLDFIEADLIKNYQPACNTQLKSASIWNL